MILKTTKLWIFPFLLLLAAAACSPSVKEQPTTEQIGIVLNNVSARSTPGFDQAETFPLKAGQTVQLLEEKQVRSGRDDEASFCYQDTWQKIRTEDGRKGWLFSQYLGKIQTETELVPDYPAANIMLDDEQYSILLLKNATIGAMTDEGLSGCPESYPVVLMRDFYLQMELIRIEDHPYNSSSYWELVSDEGAEEKITTMETRGDHVRIAVNARLQEGTGSYVVEVRREKGTLAGVVKDYQRTRE